MVACYNMPIMKEIILISYLLIVILLSLLYARLFFDLSEPVPVVAAIIVLTASYSIPAKQIVPNIKQALYCVAYCALIFILLPFLLSLLFNLFVDTPSIVNINELNKTAAGSLIYMAPQIFAALYIGKIIQWVIGRVAGYPS